MPAVRQPYRHRARHLAARFAAHHGVAPINLDEIAGCAPSESARVLSGATIQVLLFAVLAIEIKRKAPTAHTILEIIQARWGKTAHLVFFVFCLLTNIVVTSMLILGGAGVVNALTGKGRTRQLHMPDVLAWLQPLIGRMKHSEAQCR
jgi:hypothetical protein